MGQKVKPASGIGNAKAVAGPHGASVPLTNAAHGISNANWSSGITVNGSSALGAGNGTALPWDSIAEGQATNAHTNRLNTDAQVSANRNIGLQEFGIDAGYDDYKNNPFSQAAILQHNHESNQRGILTTAGQAGYSGQTGNAQGAETGRTNQAHFGIVNENSRAKANWEAEEKQAEADEQNAINGAKEGAVERASSAPGPEVPIKEKPPKPPGAPAGKKYVYNVQNNRWHLVKA